MNVVNFPVCRICEERHYYYGGRVFEAYEAVLDAMSDRDLRRFNQWASRHADRLERIQKEMRA